MPDLRGNGPQTGPTHLGSKETSVGGSTFGVFWRKDNGVSWEYGVTP